MKADHHGLDLDFNIHALLISELWIFSLGCNGRPKSHRQSKIFSKRLYSSNNLAERSEKIYLSHFLTTNNHKLQSQNILNSSNWCKTPQSSITWSNMFQHMTVINFSTKPSVDSLYFKIMPCWECWNILLSANIGKSQLFVNIIVDFLYYKTLRPCYSLSLSTSIVQRWGLIPLGLYKEFWYFVLVYSVRILFNSPPCHNHSKDIS